MGVSKRTRQKEMKKNVIAVLIILVFAFTVFSVNSIGKFIADKIISPVANFSGVKTEKVSSDTLKTEKAELYALCTGSYETFEEAQENASGNYIFKTDDGFNVLTKIKTNKEDAEKLLEDSGGAVITLTLEKVSIKITGTQAQKDTLSACFSLMTESLKNLPDLEEKLVSGKMTQLQVLSKINTLKSDFSKGISRLDDLNSKNHTVTVIKDMLMLASNLLEEINNENLSASLSYASCAYACEYFNFLDNLE